MGHYSQVAAERALREVGQLVLDPTSPLPLYHQLALALEDRIVTGSITGGALLLESSLATHVRVSKPTAGHALRELTLRGLVDPPSLGTGRRVRPRPAGRRRADAQNG